MPKNGSVKLLSSVDIFVYVSLRLKFSKVFFRSAMTSSETVFTF